MTNVPSKGLCPLMTWLVRRTLDARSPADAPENRTRIGMLAGVVGTLLSLVLCAVKGALGWVSGSVSMIADATNNLTDVASSLVIALGFRWSRKPSDEEHPFGHGRIETVITLVMAIALILVGLEVARSGLSRLLHPRPIEAPGWLLVATGVTVALKIWMAVFARRLAKLSKSHVLEADAWNHFFDVVCTLLVVVALVGARVGWPGLDGWTALAVSAFIFGTGAKYAKEAVDVLLGARPDPEEVEAVRRVVGSVEGVLGVHEVMVHHYGDVKMTSFHVEVDPGLSLREAHRLAEATEMAVESTLGWRSVAHVDPLDRSHPFYLEVSEAMNEWLRTDRRLVEFHDLFLDGRTPPYEIAFDLVVGPDVPRGDYAKIMDEMAERLRRRFDGRVRRMTIGVETVVDSAPMLRRCFMGGER